jgi:hypothetical protein
MEMKNRMAVMAAVAGCYLLTCAAGFAQNATQNHGSEGESNTAVTIEARRVSDGHDFSAAAPAAETTRKTAAKTLPAAPIAKIEATSVASLRDAQENPYLLLTYKEKDETKMVVNPYQASPTKVFGPGWGTNVDALRNNPYAPGQTAAYVDLKTLGHVVGKLL